MQPLSFEIKSVHNSPRRKFDDNCMLVCHWRMTNLCAPGEIWERSWKPLFERTGVNFDRLWILTPLKIHFEVKILFFLMFLIVRTNPGKWRDLGECPWPVLTNNDKSVDDKWWQSKTFKSGNFCWKCIFVMGGESSDKSMSIDDKMTKCRDS